MNVCLTAAGSASAIKSLVLAAAVLFGVSSFATCGQGCAPSIPQPTEAERSYTTEIIACAATAGYPGAYDHESDMRCRAHVDCKYGVGPCPDGGK